MSSHRIVWWATAVALIVVLALIAGAILRAVRELKRLTARVGVYGDLPMLKALERAERDLRRLEQVMPQLEALMVRTLAAVAIIRRGPVPPELRNALVRLRDEVAAFRSFARR